MDPVQMYINYINSNLDLKQYVEQTAVNAKGT